MTVKEIIDGLKFTVDMFLFDPTTGETYTEPRNDMDKTTIDACKGAIELLEQTRWIPVSEKLPEVRDDKYGDTSDDVLICVMDEDGYYSISTGFYGYYPNNGSYQGWWSVWTDGCDKLYSKDKVVAWMPLPQPYKESDNNES